MLRQYASSFTPLLVLEPLSEFEQQKLGQIHDDFSHDFLESKVSEGQVKLPTVASLLRLADFYRYPMSIILEEEIDRITVENNDTEITGRLDMLVVNKGKQAVAQTFF